MIVSRAEIFCASVVFFALGWSPWAAADEAETRQAIVKLVEVGWSTAPQARAASDALLAQSAAAIAGDLRALEAWTLILIQQRRYDEALKRVNQWLARENSNATALRAKVWLLTLLKDYPSALLTAEQLAEQMESMPGEATKQKEELDELAGFLGRIFGFVGGPALTAVNQEDRRNAENCVLERLDAQQKLLFEQSRDRVLQQYIELTDSKIDERDKAREAKAAERDRTLEEIAAEREKMKARTVELADMRAKQRKELNDELTQIARDDRPLAGEFSRLQSQAAGINRELGRYLLEIDSLERQAAREMNENTRDRLRREASRLRLFASRLDNDLSSLQRQAGAIDAQRGALVAQAQGAQANFNASNNAIESESNAMAKREKRLAADETRAKKAITGTTGQTLALSAQAAALTTYDTLPLEQARQRVLSSLK